MKKLYTFFAVLFSYILSAQPGPIIEGTYLPVRGTSVYQVYQFWPTNDFAPTTGPNQIWDYSTMFSTVQTGDTFLIKTFDTKDPNFIFNKDTAVFPSATHVALLRAPFQNSDSTYYYFKIDTNGVNAVGARNATQSVDTLFKPVNNDSSNWELYIPATAWYGRIIEDTSFFEGNPKNLPIVGGSNKLRSWRRKTLEGIGYGTLISPLDTFTDVLLAKEYNYSVDSFFVGNLFIPSSDPDNPFVSSFVRYYFLRNNTFGSTVLLEQQMLDTSVSSPTYFAWYTLPAAAGDICGIAYDSAMIGSSHVPLNGLKNPAKPSKAWLYRENSNFSKQDILARATIDSTGNFCFRDIPYGRYRITIRPDSASYPNAFTTYYGDTTDWLAAPEIRTITCQCDTSGLEIVLQYHNPQPPITTVLEGQLNLNLGISKNGPSTIVPYPLGAQIPNIDIIVKKQPGGKPTMSTKGNVGNGGFFQFGNLEPNAPNEWYELFIDIPGLHMAGTYSFSVTPNGANINNLNFEVGRDSIHPVNYTGINSLFTGSKNTIDAGVYPNPFTSEATVAVKLQKEGLVAIEVYNALGQFVYSINDGAKKSVGTHYYTIDNKNLEAKGVFFVKVISNNAVHTIPIVRQ